MFFLGKIVFGFFLFGSVRFVYFVVVVVVRLLIHSLLHEATNAIRSVFLTLVCLYLSIISTGAR